jgi:hypothetical protein
MRKILSLSISFVLGAAIASSIFYWAVMPRIADHKFVITERIEEIRPYAELLFFLSGIGLLIVGCYGLQQLQLVKEDLRFRSTRAAGEKALEAARGYAREFAPNYTQFTRKLVEANLEAYTGKVGDFSVASLSQSEKEMGGKRLAILYEGAGVDALNSLDWIASMFVYGLADDSIGFHIFGRSFCGCIANNYDLFALYGENHFESIKKLYETWSPRIKKAELESVRAKLDKDIASIEETSLDRIEPKI